MYRLKSVPFHTPQSFNKFLIPQLYLPSVREKSKGPGLKACATTLALLTYPDLDLSHLYV